MKRISMFVMAAMVFPYVLMADDVIPSVSDMGTSKSAFGKAIADSKTPDPSKDNDAADVQKSQPDNFGSKVSAKAQQMKDQTDKTGMGKWVSSQRSQRPADAGKGVGTGAANAAHSVGKPASVGKPSDAGTGSNPTGIGAGSHPGAGNHP